MLKKIGRKIKGNFMGPINQPEVKIDDNKKNNEIIEKKKGGICFRIHMCFIYSSFNLSSDSSFFDSGIKSSFS